ncbi:MAG: helix-turn-helix transcriptional regulator [Chitinispirillales bacterium]|jgi:transcriptional regulator with XRE-family HTH domain|nr:helix-turn-helix transcriptional regulator [Chitinispirillales bacterium]
MEINILYSNIRKRREALGMSQVELAKKLNYKSRSSVNKIELGFTDLPLSKVKEFAVALKTTASALMGWDRNSCGLSPTYEKSIKNIEREYGAEELMEAFAKLNHIGRNQALVQISNLTEVHKYTNKEEDYNQTVKK